MATGAWVVSFEVYVLKKGRWTIDHAGPDGDAARAHMQEVMRRGGVEGIKLMRDIYDPRTDKSVAHVQHEQIFNRASLAGAGQRQR